jgi:hypothetical protein
MIALGILTTWLTLTAAGFAGLSVLRRAVAREDADVGLTPAGHQTWAFNDTYVSIPKALSR